MDLLAKSCLPQVLQVLGLQSLACLQDMFCVWNGMMFCLDMLDILAEFVLPFRLGATVSSFQSQNIYLNSEASFLHWKSKLKNVWGHHKCISIL